MYKAYWDGKKEYEKFWAGRKSYPCSTRNGKKPLRRKGLWIVGFCVLFFCVLAVAMYPSERVVQPDESQGMLGDAFTEIPDFCGDDYIVLNNNIPYFSLDDYDITPTEYYSDLDTLGRCGPAFAVLHRSLMPTEDREGIGMIKPSGWHQNKYEGIVDSNPPYLYNRCHLIAFALAGENANEKNLITGTRYFNESSMLPFEKIVMKYLDTSDNHVLYRVTPYFKENELVARGVEIEAYSVEDNGEGICFNVFIYNYQPGIYIDYLTGENMAK